MMLSPQISIVLATHDRPELLRRAIESVIAQDFRPIELMIVHDGPASEETVAVARELTPKAERADVDMTFMGLEEETEYMCVPFNTGMDFTIGGWVYFMADDTTLEPGGLRALYEAAIEPSNGFPDVVYGVHFNEGDVPFMPQGVKPGRSPFIEWREDTAVIYGSSSNNRVIDTSSMLIARGALWRLAIIADQAWNESCRRLADWDLIVRGTHVAGWTLFGVDTIVNRHLWHGSNVRLTRSLREAAYITMVRPQGKSNLIIS